MYTSQEPMVFEVGEKAWLIDCFGMCTPMLFAGKEKALLIDAGVGNYDLKKLAEDLTGLQVECAVTHEHGDHIGCISLFDRVFVPALEKERIGAVDGRFMNEFLSFCEDMFCDENQEIGYFRPPLPLVSWERKPELIPVHEGDWFDLGGRTITAWRCQTHSMGHLVYADSLSGILYAGDAVSDNTGVVSNPLNPPTVVSLEDMIRGLKNLKKHEKEYSRIFGGHTEWGGKFRQIVSFEPETVDRMIQVGEKVLRNELEVFSEEGSHGSRNYAQEGRTRLYFFAEYLRDSDLPEQFRYQDEKEESRCLL